MLILRKSAERGGADHGWLNTRHTFSFADYHDPRHMGFRALRVINEDRVAPGQGFGTHGHKDMEILSLVLEGRLAHQDSLGNGGEIAPGELQRVSAGTGVRHSEANPSRDEPVHFLQIWLLPDELGVAPSYAQKRLAPGELEGRARLVVSPDGADGSLLINSDARLWLSELAAGAQAKVPLAVGRHAWVHVAKGRVQVNGVDLEEGDGAALSDEAAVTLDGVGPALVLVFDLG